MIYAINNNGGYRCSGGCLLMEKIREKVEDMVDKTDCGQSRGAIEDLEQKVSSLTALVGELVNMLNKEDVLSDEKVKELLGAYIW